VKARDAQNHAVPLALNFPLADAPPVVVDRVALSPGVPDPFRESVDFQLSLPRAGQVRLTAFDLAGRRVRTLWDGPREAGVHHITWDGRDESGQRIAPGIYWLALEADRVRTTRRVVRLR
jgi:flagellar hook assembly protein FlgD